MRIAAAAQPVDPDASAVLGAARARDHAAAGARSWRSGGALLVAAAIPAVWLAADAGLDLRDPASPAVGARLRRARAARVGPGAVAPAQVLVDTGRADGVRARRCEAAVGAARRRDVARDPEVAAVYCAARRPLRRPDAAATRR